MATLAEVREGIRARLATIDGLRTHAEMPATMNPPAAVVSRRSIEFDTTMDDDSHDTTYAVTVFVRYTDERTAQRQLDAYLGATGATSVKAAIDADPTLGDTVDWARIASVGRDRITEWENIKYLTTDLVVEVG